MSDLHEDRRWLHARDRAKTRGITTPEWIKEHGPHPSWRGLYSNSDQAIAAYQEWKVRYFRNCAMNPDYTKVEAVMVKGRQAGARTMCVDLETNPSCYEFVGAAAVAKMTERLNDMIFDDLNLCGATTGRMSSTTPNLQSLPKAASNHIMNKTIAEIQAELDAAVAQKAIDDAAADRAAHLTYLASLAAETAKLIHKIQYPTPQAFNYGGHARTLQPLALELGARLVAVNAERTLHVVVVA